MELDFKPLARALGISAANAHYLEILKELESWKGVDDFERGKITPKVFCQSAIKKFSLKLTEDEFWEVWNTVIVGPIKNVESVVLPFAQHYRTFVLTNSNEVHLEDTYRKVPWLTQFEHVFSSHEMGLRKPEEKIYQTVLHTLGVKPDSVYFLDDRQENVDAAQKLGMKAHLCKKPPEDILKALAPLL